MDGSEQEMKDTKKLKVVKLPEDEKEEEVIPQPALEETSGVDEGNTDDKSMDIPVVVKKGNFQKEQIHVSKGQVISHYEDDMDVPTFLRKQMQ